jgi:universal stress protein E
MELKNVLVALHDRECMGGAMVKAARLEHFTGAKITVVQTCWDVVSEEPTQHFPQEEIDTIASRMKEAELNNLSAELARYRERVAELEAEILWSKHHDEAVARFAIESGSDLIVAPRHSRSGVRRLLLPEELKLAARSHAPLLLTSASAWREPTNVLVALDAGDRQHAALNSLLIEWGRTLGQTLGGELHLVAASPPPSASSAPNQTLEDFQREAEARRMEALRALADAHPHNYGSLQVKTGEVCDVIDDVASACEVDIVVMGTAARTGLKRLFIGNSAESVLSQLTEIDIFTVPAPDES